MSMGAGYRLPQRDDAAGAADRRLTSPAKLGYDPRPMHYDAHQPVIDDLEARIVTLRDSL
ncbi:MAG: hypothetical protein JNL80_17340 [Phycisphaerae bacterium]|jgi:hypothetical protein|nr:hypothetical protein [Phycisphaerae bacterium]